jgi:hypothetical protein
MPSISRLVVRDDSSQSTSNLTPTMVKLLIALLALALSAITLVLILWGFRAFNKRSKLSKEKTFHEKMASSNYKRLTIETTRSSQYVVQEKRKLMDESSSPPPSPLPEIRITFPDEVDTTGRPQSGRVVVVRMGDNSAVGLEPLEDPLPPYQRTEGGRFQSVDLDSIGGLKEKELEKHG